MANVTEYESETAKIHRDERRAKNASLIADYVTSSAPWVNGNSGRSDLNSDIPNNTAFKAYDVYDSTLMLATGWQRGYNNNRWLSFDEIRDLNLSIRNAKALVIDSSSPITHMRDTNGDEYGEPAFERIARFRNVNFFNIGELTQSGNGIFRSQPPPARYFSARDNKVFTENRNAAIKMLRGSGIIAKDKTPTNEELRDYLYDDFDKYDAVLLEHDPRYKGQSEKDKELLVKAHHAISEYFISRELGMESQGVYALSQSEAKEFGELIRKTPTVLLDISHDVDIAVDAAFDRPNIYSAEKAYSASPAVFKTQESVGPFPRVVGPEGFLEIAESDNLIYSDAVKLPEQDLKTVRSLERGQSMVFVNYQGSAQDNLFLSNTFLPTNLMTLAEAEKAFKEADDAYSAEHRREPVKFTMYSNVRGRLVRYSGRYDLGADEGGLARHLLRHNTDYLHNARYRDFLRKSVGNEGLHEKMREYAFAEQVLVPMVHRELEIPLNKEDMLFYEMQHDEEIFHAEDFSVSDEYAYEEEENYKPLRNITDKGIDSERAAYSGEAIRETADIKKSNEEVKKMADSDLTANAVPNAGQAGSMSSAAKEGVSKAPKMQTFEQLMNAVLHGPRAFHEVSGVDRARTQADYKSIAREDAIAAEGDRLADDKQSTIAHIKDSIAYSEREAASSLDDVKPVTFNSSIHEDKTIAGAMLKSFIQKGRTASAARAAKEEKIMAETTNQTNEGKEQKFENASYKQRKLLLNYWDNLHPYHKAHFDKAMLDPDRVAPSEYKVDKYLMSEAIGVAIARKSLTHFIPQEEIDKLTRQETLDKQKEYSGKITLEMQKALSKEGIKFDASMSNDEAKKIMANLPATDKQIDMMIRNGMVEEEALKQTRGQASTFLKAASDRYKQEQAAPVSQKIYDIALEAGLVTKGQSYHNSEWEKDCAKVEAPESLRAYIERWNLQRNVDYMTDPEKPAAKYYGTKPNNLKAVLKVIDNHIKLLAEKEQAPMDKFQGEYFAKNGIEIDKNTPWIQAQEVICKDAYDKRLVGKSTCMYLLKHPHIELPQSFTEARDKMLYLSDEQKAKIREDVRVIVDENKRADRLEAIRNVPLTPREKSWITDTARLVAYDHLDRSTMTIVGAEKDMAKALVVGIDKVSDYAVSRLPVLTDEQGKKIAPSKEQFLAHVITNVLPQNVGPGKYTEAMNQNMKLVAAAEKALAKEQAKDKVRTEVKETQKSKAQAKNKSQSAEM